MPKFDYLTDEQLLESIIPSSAVKEMIATYGGVQQALLNATARELKKISKHWNKPSKATLLYNRTRQKIGQQAQSATNSHQKNRRHFLNLQRKARINTLKKSNRK